MNFLSLNNPIVSGIYKIANMILVSIMWLVLCIPVFTAGASTSALYYTVQKNIKNDRDNSWSAFWQGFKASFKTATPVSLIYIVIALVLFGDIAIIETLSDMGKVPGYINIFFWVVLIIASVYAFWIFSYIARFNCTVKMAFKNAAVLAVIHIPITLALTLIGAFSILLIWLMHVTIAILPAATVLTMSYLTEKVFRLYMDDDDKREEDERNMEWHNDYGQTQGKGRPEGKKGLWKRGKRSEK